MNHRDIATLMAGAAPVIAKHIAQAVAPLAARLDAIEQRFDAMPVPREFSPDDFAPLILAEVRKVAEVIPESVATAVAAEVAKVDPPDVDTVAATVIERMGGEIDKVHAKIDAMAEPEELPDIGAMVQEALDALPKPQDGKSPSPDELRPLVAEAVSAAVSGLPVAKDGADVTDLLIDRDGALVATLSNGRTKSLGKIVGQDGKDGTNADEAEVEQLKAQLYAVTEEISELREAAPVSTISDEEFQRRVEAATGHEAVAQRAKAIRTSTGEARSFHLLREAIVEAKQPVINVTVPITMPKRGKEVTTVKQHDDKGRILQFEKQEVDD